MRYDFFISYTAVDRAWAEWIAAVLEEAGYRVIVQAWDFRPGGDFAVQMHDAMTSSERTIAVVSRAYYESQFAAPEWAHALAQDPTGRKGTLLPVRVDDVVLEGVFRTRVHIDLTTEDEPQRRAALLAGVSAQRAKPDERPGLPTIDRPRYAGALPPVWRLPHERNPTFAGRADALAGLDEAFGRAPAIAAVAGLGGVGKSALATEYCYSRMDRYQVVWWLRGQSSELIVADLAELAGPLELERADGADTATTAAQVQEWLAQHDQWLLVVDDVTGPAELRGLLPQGGGGHVLITSRSPAWRRFAARQLDLGVLDPETAVSLLVSRTGQDESPDAGRLAELLGHLPLALELAAAFMEQQGVDFRAYRLRVERGVEDLLAAGVEAPPDTPHTLATVWSASLRAVEAASPAAADLIRLCAFLAADDLPRWAVAAGSSGLPPRLRAATGTPEAVANLLSVPRGYSLVTTFADGISTHGLVQAVVRQSLDAESTRDWAASAVRLVAAAFPLQAANLRLQGRAARVYPHALAAVDHAEALGVEPEPTVRVLDRAATYVQATGYAPELVAQHRERAIGLAVTALEGDLPGWLYNNHGEWLGSQGETEAAVPLFRQAIEARERTGLADDPSTAVTRVNLGVALRSLGDLDGSVSQLERAVAVLDAFAGPASSPVAGAHSHLGQTYLAQRRYDDAATQFQRAIDIYTVTAGPTGWDTMTAMNLLANARARGGVPQPWMTESVLRYEDVVASDGRALAAEPGYRAEAEEQLREAIRTGSDRARFDLWELLRDEQGREDEASQLLRAAAELGVPEALYWLGRELSDAGDPTAEAVIRRAIAKGQTFAWYDLGLLLSGDGSGRDAEAEAAFREALSHGHEEARNDLGLLLLQWPGRESEGEAELRTHGSRGHARGWYNLASALRGDSDRIDEAEEALRQAINGGYPAAHLELGILYATTDRPAEAEQAFLAALATGDLNAHYNLGVLYHQHYRLAEAEEHYLAALAAGHPRAETMLHRLRGTG